MAVGTGIAVGGGEVATGVAVACGTRVAVGAGGVGGREVAARVPPVGTGVGVVGGSAVASGPLVGVGMPGPGPLLGPLGPSGSMVRTRGVEGGLAGTEAAFSVGDGFDGAVEAAGCSESLLKASDHQPSPRVPGPDRTWTTPFLSTPTLEDWEVML